MSVASFAALLSSLLPKMTEWSGIYWIKIEEEVKLMELWIEEVRGFDDMTASLNDILSVQKRMVIKGWLLLVDVQVKADSMAITFSS